MTGTGVTPPEQTDWPLTVVIRRTMRESKGWRVPAWSLAAIEPAQGRSGMEALRHDDGARDFAWHGLTLRLRRSDAETYWFNLTSQQPSLFVICREDPQYGLMPAMVTLDQDETARQQESEAEIFSTPLPEWLAIEVERFVLAHYRPSPRKGKRRRKPQEQSHDQ